MKILKIRPKSSQSPSTPSQTESGRTRSFERRPICEWKSERKDPARVKHQKNQRETLTDRKYFSEQHEPIECEFHFMWDIQTIQTHKWYNKRAARVMKKKMSTKILNYGIYLWNLSVNLWKILNKNSVKLKWNFYI